MGSISYAVKVLLKDAEKMRMFLLKNNLHNPAYVIKRDEKYLYFPINDIKRFNKKDVVKTKLEEKEKKVTTESIFQKILTKKESELLPRAHDIIGEIIVLEIPNELSKKEKEIAQAYLDTNNHVTTIVKKSDIHSGVFRTRKLKILAGKKTKETLYKENGVRLKVHLENMYFSNRLAHERLRIAKKVKKNEDVLVMFSGAAPYVCVIGRKSEPKHIWGIEINPKAHVYAQKNVKLNKIGDKVSLYNGDVKNVLPKIKKKFDRVVMPLPKTGEEFLPLALQKVKSGGTIHYYAFLDEKEIHPYKKRIKEICLKEKKRNRIVRVVKVGQHAPYVYRVCYDIKILENI